MSIKNNLRWAREQKGYSQKYVSITLQVSSPTVSEWESGKKTPAVENLIKLSNLYGRSIDFLIGLCPKPIESSLWNSYHIKYELDKQKIPDAAKRIGMTDEHLEEIANGKISPTVDELVYLSELLKCSLDYLVSRTGSENLPLRSNRLSDSENTLLNIFTRVPELSRDIVLSSIHGISELNEEGQGKVLDYIDDLVRSGKYLKNLTRLEWIRAHK